MIEFKDIERKENPATPEYVKRADIYLKGRRVGDLDQMDGGSLTYRVWLIPFPNTGTGTRVFGYGKTREEALSDAIENFSQSINNDIEFLSSIKSSAELQAA